MQGHKSTVDCGIAGDLRVLLFTGIEEEGTERGHSREMVGTDTGTRLCQV